MKKFYGVSPALVIDNLDPNNLGRVQVRFQLMGVTYEPWARIATLMAGENRGSWFIPDVGDEPYAFSGSPIRRGYLVGTGCHSGGQRHF